MNEQNEKGWMLRAQEKWKQQNWNSGDIVTHQWLHWALEFPEPTTIEEAKQYNWINLRRMDEFRYWLLHELKIALQSVKSKGYWIVPPAEQARVAAEEWSRGIARASYKSEAILRHTRMEVLDNRERQQHIDTQNRINAMSQLMTKEKINIFTQLEQHLKQRPLQKPMKKKIAKHSNQGRQDQAQ